MIASDMWSTTIEMNQTKTTKEWSEKYQPMLDARKAAQ
jgi:hypothetical protein